MNLPAAIHCVVDATRDVFLNLIPAFKGWAKLSTTLRVEKLPLDLSQRFLIGTARKTAQP